MDSSSNLGVVDIYGHIPDKTEILIGVGNYNNVHGLLTYFPVEDLLQMRTLSEVITPSVLQLVLTYERPSHVNKTNRVYFSLAVKGFDANQKYINVKIELDNDKKVACACLAPDKAFFWIDYSSIDNTPRSQLLAGALYSLQTTFGEQDYVVSWKIQGFSNGDLVIFLPTTWYEQEGDFCQVKNGATILIESLHQLGFKGYTTQRWSEDVTQVIHCTDDRQCGECLGPCPDPKHICYPNLTSGNLGKKFICGSPTYEPKLNESVFVSFNESQNAPQGTTATWIAAVSIVIIVALLAWGLARTNNDL